MVLSWTIGSKPDSDLVVDLPKVSGHHCRLTRDDDGHFVEDLGSTNGTYVNGVRITARTRVTRRDSVTLGVSIPMPWPADPAEPIPAKSDPALVPRLSLQGSEMIIGREADCGRVLDLPMISAHHARLFRADDGVRIEDLGSSNGTFVNGRRIDREEAVKPGDLIGLGSYTLVLADDLRDVASEEGGLTSPTPSRPVGEPPGRWADLIRRMPSAFDPAWRLPALLGQAPLAALLIVMGAGIASPAATIQGGSEVNPRTIAAILYGLGLAAIWFGLSDAVLGGLLESRRLPEGPTSGRIAHLLSRILILGMLCVCQCVVAWILVAYVAGLQGPGWLMLGLLILASGVGMVLGLLLVATALRPEATWGLLACSVVAIGLLGGGAWPLSRMPPWARMAAGANPLRWTYEGLLLLEAGGAPAGEVREGTSPVRVRELVEADFPAQSLRMGTRADVMALALMGIGLMATAAFIASERGRGP